MLILTRTIGQSIIINDDIVIAILGVKRHQVRLGINAPKILSIYREEIWQKIQMGIIKNDPKKLNNTGEIITHI